MIFGDVHYDGPVLMYPPIKDNPDDPPGMWLTWTMRFMGYTEDGSRAAVYRIPRRAHDPQWEDMDDEHRELLLADARDAMQKLDEA